MPRRHRRSRLRPRRRRRKRRPRGGRPALGHLHEPLRASLESAPALWPLEQHVGRPGALAAVRRPSRRPAVHRRSAAAGSARVEGHCRGRQRRVARSAYFGTYERVGRLQIRALWDEIPQFYSVDTRTAYTPTATDGTIVLARPRAAVDPERHAPTSTPTCPPRYRRNSTCASAATLAPSPSRRCPRRSSTSREASPARKHSGELPWGASFGFSNDVEVPLPYESRTNDLDIGLEWHDTRSMFRTAYTNSWFDNQADTLIWDSPLRLTDGVETPGRGRMALWPSNSMQTLSAAGHTKLARRTQVTGSLAFGWWSNDQPLQPFTINSALPTFALPRANTDAKAQSISTNVSLVSRPAGRLAIQHAVPALRLQQRHAGHGDYRLRQLRLRTSEPVRPAVPSCSRTTATRSTPTRPGRGSGRWRSPWATPTITTATTFASSSRAPSTCCSSRRMPWDLTA